MRFLLLGLGLVGLAVCWWAVFFGPLTAQSLLLVAGGAGAVLSVFYLLDAFVHVPSTKEVDEERRANWRRYPGLGSFLGFLFGGLGGGAGSAYLIGRCFSSTEIAWPVILVSVVVLGVTFAGSIVGCIAALQDTNEIRSPSWFFVCTLFSVALPQAVVLLAVWGIGKLVEA
jgi:hypothetical protein